MLNESIITVLSMIGAVHLVALMSPGPDFALILGASVQKGKRHAMWAALGLSFGVLFHVMYCLFGISILINKAPYTMKIISTVGSCYLLFQGYKTISFAFKIQKKEQNFISSVKSNESHENNSVFRAFANGFVTNAFNPKAFAYFFSFFATAITTIQLPYLRVAAGAEVFFLTLGWFSFLAQVVSVEKFLHWMKKNDYIINIIIGMCFIFFGISMLLFSYV